MSIHIETIKEIYEKSNLINNKLLNESSYEIKIRTKDLNLDLNNLLDKINNIELEMYRNRKYISQEAKNLLIEEEKKNKILEQLLPSMTLLSIAQNDMINGEYKNKYIENIMKKQIDTDLNTDYIDYKNIIND